MNQTEPRAVRDGLQYIHEVYGFLLERGYAVISAQEAEQGWQVMLQRGDLFVSVLRSRGDDFVSMRTGTQPPGELIDLGSVILAATGEKIFLYASHSQALQTHLDRIEAYFAGEYLSDPESLRRARDAYHEPIYKVQPEIPEQPERRITKEPKRIPLLYYPLLAVILFLLFGALATLYAVLLDRLFTAFSLQADFYSLVTFVGAIVLASGTLVLLRRWIKWS
ncbi:MAG: hypothetical protein ACM3XO_03155 [Bacteroidota bacterium]